MPEVRSRLIFLAATLALAAGCGEKIDKAGVTIDEPYSGHVCDLVESGELSQLFTTELVARRDEATPRACSWTSADGPEEVFRYLLYRDLGLDAVLQRIQEERGTGIESERVPGLGDAAVWTPAGLLVTSNELTLQITPASDDDVPRELYEQLARLLFERLEDAA